VNKKGFKINVYQGKAGYFEIDSSDNAFLIAFLLRRLRLKSGFTLSEVARQLGAKSNNAYARYEQGKSVPTIDKLSELIKVVSPKTDFVLTESRAN